jgi:hypothetical protein
MSALWRYGYATYTYAVGNNRRGQATNGSQKLKLDDKSL